jgi:hypothetical protein
MTPAIAATDIQHSVDKIDVLFPWMMMSIRESFRLGRTVDLRSKLAAAEDVSRLDRSIATNDLRTLGRAVVIGFGVGSPTGTAGESAIGISSAGAVGYGVGGRLGGQS